MQIGGSSHRHWSQDEEKETKEWEIDTAGPSGFCMPCSIGKVEMQKSEVRMPMHWARCTKEGDRLSEINDAWHAFW